MGALLLTLLVVTGVECLKLFRLRRYATPLRRSMMDLVLGFNALFFIGALAEGYLMARVSPLLVYFYAMTAIGSNAIRATEQEMQASYELYDEYDDEHEAAYDEAHPDEDASLAGA
jgi:hypothetical protein